MVERFAAPFPRAPPLLFFAAGFFVAERALLDRFALDDLDDLAVVPRLLFLTAGRRVDFFALLPRDPLLFFAERAALFDRLLDAFVPLRFAAVLPPDFPRDFLARVAMILLLGVGGECQLGG